MLTFLAQSKDYGLAAIRAKEVLWTCKRELGGGGILSVKWTIPGQRAAPSVGEGTGNTCSIREKAWRRRQSAFCLKDNPRNGIIK